MSACECSTRHDWRGRVCGDQQGALTCTRPEGHDGPHAACTPAEHPKEEWE